MTMNQSHLNKPVLAVGVMTGNSLDGIDLVLTAFHSNGEIVDLCSHFEPFDPAFYHAIRQLQRCVSDAKGQMRQVAQVFKCSVLLNGERVDWRLDSLHDYFIQRVSEAVERLKEKRNQALTDSGSEPIDVIGFHGQTLDHCPPSRGASEALAYTVQLGCGQRLADLTGITVVNDFRSDDVMAGGEGAPLVPGHNLHLSQALDKALIFCNAGNTGNVAVVTRGEALAFSVIGWDAGPFNHYPDTLMRRYLDQSCDREGALGATGSINHTLFTALFRRSTRTLRDENFLTLPPPKSSDPSFYAWLPELDDPKIPLADKLRTCEFFSAYVLLHSLSLTPETVQLPSEFVLFGGGWLNRVARNDFECLLTKPLTQFDVLSEAFCSPLLALRQRLAASGQEIIIRCASVFGFNDRVMEARLVADLAYCRLRNKPFTAPSMTGVAEPTVCGVVHFPGAAQSQASDVVLTLLGDYDARKLAESQAKGFVGELCSRASGGWQALAG